MELEDIRQRLDCRQLAERYGVRFRNRSSSWWLAHCFNAEAHAHGDRNPSLSVGPQGYKCFSANCAISGDVFTLIAEFEELDVRQEFERVLQISAEHAGLDYEELRDAGAAGYRDSWSSRSSSRRWNEPRRTPKPPRRGQTSSPRSRSRRGRGPLGHARRRGRSGTRQGPPRMAAHLPESHESSFEIDPRHVRLEIMKRIWEILAPLELPDRARDWLSGRGIRPEIAHAYGCRDWGQGGEALVAMLEGYDVEELVDAGLAREDGETGRLKRWVGVRAARGESWARGLGLPLVHPGWPMAPIAWRWRLYRPFETRRGATLKALAQYGGRPAFPSIPLGITPPGAQALARVARWPSQAADPEAPRHAVVLCEGEPDWLSVADVAAELDTDLYVVPVGLVAMSHGFAPEFVGLLEEAERIICVMDRGRAHPRWEGKTGGQVVVDQIRGLLLEGGRARGEDFDTCFERVDNMIVEALQPDDRDVNDLHVQGTLGRLIRETLGELI